LFVNDPWELIAESIHRAVPDLRVRDIAHSIRRQATDYFRTATVADELAVRPVLLYYAFLNLSKAFAIAKGNVGLVRSAYHGLSCEPRGRSISNSFVKLDFRRKPAVFEELLKQFQQNPSRVPNKLILGQLLPQILPGHRLWCYAAKKPERFISVERFQLLHNSANKEVWVDIQINRSDLDRLNLTDRIALSHSGLSNDFEVAGNLSDDTIHFQQRTPDNYASDPMDGLATTVSKCKNLIWETVRIISPYRKAYIYCCPMNEQQARMPQIVSIYLLMFFLGSVTRYAPVYFEDLFESKYGPFFEAFISESPMQFLYLMASEIVGREVSRPAII
jgi:hypothetical protein